VKEKAMKKIVISMLFALAALPAFAQEHYT